MFFMIPRKRRRKFFMFAFQWLTKKNLVVIFARFYYLSGDLFSLDLIRKRPGQLHWNIMKLNSHELCLAHFDKSIYYGTFNNLAKTIQFSPHLQVTFAQKIDGENRFQHSIKSAMMNGHLKYICNGTHFRNILKSWLNWKWNYVQKWDSFWW
jgi:hypothetical protein